MIDFKEIAKFIFWPLRYIWARPVRIIKFYKLKEFYDSTSYYPEVKPRSIFSNYCYQAKQIWTNGIHNEFFYLYGLDVKSDVIRNEYLPYLPFQKRRNFLNYESNPHNSTCVLRNKLYFDIFAKSFGIHTPTIKAFYSNNHLYIWKDHFVEILFSDIVLLPNQTLFCKDTHGECGEGIFILTIKDGSLYVQDKELSVEQLELKIKDFDYIFQEKIVQHPRMSELYSGSINTMRLVTVRSLKDGQLYLMPSILRIGANGSYVDNTSQGGIAVGFDLESGQLNEYGFHKPQFGLKVDAHPNTGVKLKDFFIPFIKEAEEQALFFHSMLGDIHSIGWDIAIGPEGPIFIEGNDNWEINGPQVGNHGLKKEFDEYFFSD